jgi:hypothetical protein
LLLALATLLAGAFPSQAIILEQATAAQTPRWARLLDLRFFELDVLARDGIILLENKLFSRRARIFLRDVEESRAGRRQ